MFDRMSHVAELYAGIVSALVAAGAVSAYSADANEPDPRYLSYGVRAAGKKEIIKQFRSAIKQLSVAEKITLARQLVESRVGEQQSVALFILEQVPEYFVPNKLDELDAFVRCLHGWSKIDSYTGSLLREVLGRYPDELLALVRQWNRDPDMWLRRASVVLFTRKVAKSGLHTDFALEMCHNLRFDREDLVLKGVGWSLKDMMRHDKARIFAYVQQLRAEGLYALRDLKGAERAAILGK